jgi:hypothetical protein
MILKTLKTNSVIFFCALLFVFVFKANTFANEFTEWLQGEIDSGNKFIEIRQGTNVLDAPIRGYIGGIVITGQGAMNTILRVTHDDGPTFHIESDDGRKLFGFELRNMLIRKVDVPQSVESEAHIKLVYMSHVNLDNLYIEGGYRQVYADSVGELRITNSQFRVNGLMPFDPDPESGHIFITASNGVCSTYLSNVNAHDDHLFSGGKISYALMVDGYDYITSSNSHYGGGSIGNIVFRNTSNINMTVAKFVDNYFDSNHGSNIVILEQEGDGIYTNITFTSCLFRNGFYDAITIMPGAVVRDLQVNGGTMMGYRRYGIYIGSDLVTGFSAGAGLTFNSKYAVAGIRVIDGVEKFRIGGLQVLEDHHDADIWIGNNCAKFSVDNPERYNIMILSPFGIWPSGDKTVHSNWHN